MKRENPIRFTGITGANRSCALVMITAVAMLVGSASGALTSINPINQFGDPFGGDEFLKDFDNDLPIVGGDDTKPDDGFDYRAHSDVPDLPDSDEDSQNNILFLGDPFSESSWHAQDSDLGFQDIYAPMTGYEDHEPRNLSTPSPVPSPGGIGVLGVLATVVAARRKR